MILLARELQCLWDVRGIATQMEIRGTKTTHPGSFHPILVEEASIYMQDIPIASQPATLSSYYQEHESGIGDCSRVGNKVYFRDSEIMLHKLFLVEGLKVTGEGLGNHGVNYGLGCPWTRIQFKALIGLLVCRLKFEFLRLIVRHSTCNWY